MKGINPIKVFSVFLVVSYLLSACAGGAAPTVSAGSDKILARSVVYMGVVENIDDDQWTINGITVTVDPTIVRDGPFSTGDRVKVEAVVNEDGSLTVSRLEAVDPGDASTLPQLGDDDDSNSNDDNSNDDNANDSNFDDDNGNDANANSNDDGSAANSNDDDSSNTNSNDDNSNDDDGSNTNDDDNSNGSNSNDDDDDDDSNSNDDDDDDD